MKINEMKSLKIKKSIALIIMLAMSLSMLAGTLCFAAGDQESAAVGDTTGQNVAVVNGAVEILKYDFDATVEKSHSYKVKEVITVSLPDDTQSIDFIIPNGNFRVDNIQVENANYEAKRGDDLSKVTIIDHEKLTRGVHSYTIAYTVREYADRDDDADMFFFTVLSPGWEQPIADVDINIEFPKDFPWSDMQFYAGQFGIQDENRIKFDADESSKTVHITASKLPENFGISVKAALPNDYWEGEIDGNWAIGMMIVTMLAVMAILGLMWIIGGRDPKVKKTLEDHPIDGISPIEIGYVFTGSVHTRDIMAWLVYLAQKGYLKISEYKPKKYSLIRCKYPENEEKFVRSAYDELFEDIPENRGIDMDEMGPRLRRLKTSIEEDVAAGFSSKDMSAYKPLSRVFRFLGASLYGIALGVACALRYSYEYMTPNYAEAIVVGLLAAATALLLCWERDKQYYAEENAYIRYVIVAALLFAMIPAYVSYRIITLTGQILAAGIVMLASLACGWLIAIMRARAKGNAELTMRFMQLRHFIYHPTPKEVVKNYVEDNNYYYEMVPYALLFNGLETWSISFLTMNIDSPDWYSDDIEGHAHSNLRRDFTVTDFARDMKAFNRTMIDAYHSMIRKHRKG